MVSESKIKVLLYRHMLKSGREVHEVDRGTFREIYKQLKLELPITQYTFLDGDTLVKNYSTVPTSENIYIRATFAGDGGGSASEDEGKDMMNWGIAGILLAPFFGAFAFVAAIGGALSFLYGYWLYVQEGTSSYSSTAEPSISGASNSLRNNQKVPVLLGRHLVTPWYAAIPYASYDAIAEKSLVDDSKYQYLNMLMGNTYANAKIHEASIYLGDIPFTTYQEDSADYALIDFQEDSVAPTYFPVLITQSDENLLIARGDTEDYDDPITYTRTSAQNSYKVELIFQLPNGMYRLNDGDYSNRLLKIDVWWKNVDDDDTEYVGINSDGTARFSISDNEKSTRRFKVTKEFDNTLSTDSEYNEDRQYTFKIRRFTNDDSDSEYADSEYTRTSSLYLEAIKSYTGIFDEVNEPDTYPILPATQAKLNICSLQVKATDTLDGTIDDLNYEMTAYMPVYSGTGTGPDQWSYGLTRNPASAFLYVLTNSYVNQDPIETADLETRINYEALETWYTFCEDLELQCNHYFVNDTTVEDVLKSICSVAFASWNVIDNQYTIYIDSYNNTVTQLFTPRNSYDYSGSKAFGDVPTGVAATFVNSDQSDSDDDDDQSSGGFEEEVRYVYSDGRDDSDPEDDDEMLDITIFGAVTSTQVWRLAMYYLAITKLRPEEHKFTVDIEHIMCTRWDRIKLQHDVPLLGISSGRILAPIESDGETVGFTSDEIISFETGVDYGVEIRYTDGTITNHTVQNTESDTYTILFETAISGVDLLFQDDLFSFGEEGSETLDLIITNIEALDNESATLTCVDYDETIYDIYMADSATVPDYVSKISSGGNSGAITLNTLPETQDEANAATTSSVETTSKVDYRVSAVATTGYAVTTDSAYYPSILEGDSLDTIAYINYDYGNYVYSGYVSSGASGTQLNAVSSKSPRFYSSGTEILYINVEDGNSLYLKSALVLETGTQIYSGDVYNFTIDPVTENIFVYDYTNVYELDSTDSYAILNTYTLGAISMVCTDDSYIYYVKSSDSYIYRNTTSFDNEELFYDGDVTFQVRYASETTLVYFIKSDLLVYYKETSGTDTSGATIIDYGVALTGSFDVDSEGTIVYSNNYTGTIYVVNEATTIQNASLESEVFTHSFTGSTTIASDVVTDVDTDDLDILSIGDTVIGTGISDNTYISYLGSSFFTMTQVATSSVPDEDIIATGSRITLNANKVIIEGSIEARLLSASAINSKARDDNGDYITEIDLDSGTEIKRKQDGTEVWDFDPSRTGSELIIDGTITFADSATTADSATVADSANDVADGIISTSKIDEGNVSLKSSDYVSGSAGWAIDKDGDAEFNSAEIRGTISSSNYVSGSAGWEINEDGNAEFQDVKIRGFTMPDSGDTYTVTVAASGGDYTLISEAFEALSQSYMTFVNGGVFAIVEVEDGFEITENIEIVNVNLGWITLSGGSTSPIVISSSLTDPVFSISQNAVGPNMDLYIDGSAITASNPVCVFLDINSKLSITYLEITGFYTAMSINGASSFVAENVYFIDTDQYCIYATDNSSVNVLDTLLTYTNGAALYGVEHILYILNGAACYIKTFNGYGCDKAVSCWAGASCIIQDLTIAYSDDSLAPVRVWYGASFTLLNSMTATDIGTYYGEIESAGNITLCRSMTFTCNITKNSISSSGCLFLRP